MTTRTTGLTPTSGGSDWRGFLARLQSGDESTRSVTGWVGFSQLEVDLYGGLVGDMDPMHNDPDWDPGKERWGGAIVIGTHLVSMLPELLHQHGFPVRAPDVRFEPLELPRARFTAPLPVGHRVRDHLEVLAVSDEDMGRRWRVHTKHTLEREHLEKPFMVAELITTYREA
jgi:acyl dehydratase